MSSTAAIPDAARQAVHWNLALPSVHGGHDGSDQPAVGPQTGADLGRRRAQRRLQGSEQRGRQHEGVRLSHVLLEHQTPSEYLQLQVRQGGQQQHVDDDVMSLRKSSGQHGGVHRLKDRQAERGRIHLITSNTHTFSLA